MQIYFSLLNYPVLINGRIISGWYTLAWYVHDSYSSQNNAKNMQKFANVFSLPIYLFKDNFAKC